MKKEKRKEGNKILACIFCCWWDNKKIIFLFRFYFDRKMRGTRGDKKKICRG
jgi:hypothetical protein